MQDSANIYSALFLFPGQYHQCLYETSLHSVVKVGLLYSLALRVAEVLYRPRPRPSSIVLEILIVPTLTFSIVLLFVPVPTKVMYSTSQVLVCEDEDD